MLQRNGFKICELLQRNGRKTTKALPISYDIIGLSIWLYTGLLRILVLLSIPNLFSFTVVFAKL